MSTDMNYLDVETSMNIASPFLSIQLYQPLHIDFNLMDLKGDTEAELITVY